MKMREAIERFSLWRKPQVKPGTNRGYDRELKHVCLFLRNPDICEIQDFHIMEYLNGIIEMGWHQNSLLSKCVALKEFFKYLKLKGYRVMDPELIPMPRKEYNIPRVATEDAYKKLVESIPKDSRDARHIRNLAIVNLLWDTGARNGEVMSLDVDDIDLEGRMAVIKTEKSRGRRPIRQIFWTEETNNNLKKWLERREKIAQKVELEDPNALFICLSGERVGMKFSIKGVGEMLRRYANRAKMPYMNAHSFRHKMGHTIIEQGGSAADVMNILGHSSLASSSIYTMMTGKELENRYRMFRKG